MRIKVEPAARRLTRRSAVRDELFRTIGRMDGKETARAEQNRLLASLLRGDGAILGIPARIVFPDGLPDGLTVEFIADILSPDEARPIYRAACCCLRRRL